ncbi:amidohydrolase family protein [Clostridium sporogenes]|uniref:amidohydrolase family protein n=1 Tax=Clostridium sporogenes TaxID=1509 RepID=UPI0006B2752D|nr:amidohydrolase family protein [Clostridium sporogenes]KOY65410.1 hypothetical protein AN649_13095 [Clostridium sporogenes]MDS1006660.1 amidohydrolase family protein [Clostridium sporogenes]
MKIAVSNFEHSKMFQANLNKASSQAKIAANKGCDIMIFHEWFLGINPVATIPNKVTDQLSQIAKENNIMIISGSLRYMNANGRMQVGSLIIENTGEIIYIQPKLNLYEDEKKWLTPGESVNFCKTKYGNILVLSGLDGMTKEFLNSIFEKLDEKLDLLVLQCTEFTTEGAAKIRKLALEISNKQKCRVVIAGLNGTFYDRKYMGESLIIEDEAIKYQPKSDNQVLIGFQHVELYEDRQVIDSHVHIIFRDPGEILVNTKVERLVEKSVDIPTKQAILNFMNRAGIDKSIIFDWSGALQNDFITSNEKVAELSKYNDRFIGFGVPSPKEAKYVDNMVQLGLNGLKFNPSLQGFYTDSEDFIKVCSKASEYNLPVLIHSGPESAGKLKYDMPVYLDDVAIECPNLNIIIAHIGVRGFTSEQAIMVAEKNPNVYLETSWASEELIKEAIRKVGVDNIVFGSDFPSRNPITEFQKIKNLLDSNFLSSEDYYKIVGQNIRRLLSKMN